MNNFNDIFQSQLNSKIVLEHIVRTHSLDEIAKMFNTHKHVVFNKTKEFGVQVPEENSEDKKEKIKSNCLYYPCHDFLETCERCYCVLYPFDCGGKWVITNGFKDCSGCVIPHTKKGQKIIEAKLSNVDTLKLNSN